MTRRKPTASAIIAAAGTTFCEQAGFTLRDKPAPLYQLSVLSTVLAKPISAELAVAAARELRRAGVRTAAGTLRTTWQHRVDALTRAHYRRFDESTATILADAATFLRDEYRGDLRRLADAAAGDAGRAAELLTAIPGIGPSGADIFLREAQRVWPWLQPYVDDRVAQGAQLLGLPRRRADLVRVFARAGDPAALAAGLVRATLDDDLVRRLTGAG